MNVQLFVEKMYLSAHVDIYMLMIGDLEKCCFMYLWVMDKFIFLHRQERTSLGLLLYVNFCDQLVQP